MYYIVHDEWQSVKRIFVALCIPDFLSSRGLNQELHDLEVLRTAVDRSTALQWAFSVGEGADCGVPEALDASPHASPSMS